LQTWLDIPPSLVSSGLTSIGVIKTYHLTFESIAPMHAFFDRAIARNSWSISSRTLREFVEHFGSGTEQLDIYSEDGRVSLTSYTEKIVSGNGKILAMEPRYL
jgi:cell cycle checkpoint control protein RAD9A